MTQPYLELTKFPASQNPDPLTKLRPPQKSDPLTNYDLSVMTIGRLQRTGSLNCPHCKKPLTQHGLDEHLRKQRCRILHPRPKPKSRQEQRKDQTKGQYYDPFKRSRITIHAGEDGRFKCKYCGKRLMRIDKMAQHVEHSCTAAHEVIYMENLG